MDTFKKFIAGSNRGHVSGGWVTPKGEVLSLPEIWAHGKLAIKAGYASQMDALQKGAVRFIIDSIGASIEIHKNNARPAADLVMEIGEHPVFYLDVINDQWDVVNHQKFTSAAEIYKFLQRYPQ